MGKWFSIRKPRLKIGKKGVKIQAPSGRIGKDVGVNVSKKGVRPSVRTKFGTLNKDGCSLKLGMLLIAAGGLMMLAVRVVMG